MTLRTKLILFFIISTLPPIIVGVNIFFIVATRTALEQTTDKLSSIIELEKARVSQEMNRRTDQATAFAQKINHQYDHATSSKWLTETLDNMRTSHRDIDSLTLISRDTETLQSERIETPFAIPAPIRSAISKTTVVNVARNQGGRIYVTTLSPIDPENPASPLLQTMFDITEQFSFTTHISSFGQTGELLHVKIPTQGTIEYLTLPRFATHTFANDTFSTQFFQNKTTVTDTNGRDYRGVRVIRAENYLEQWHIGIIAKVDYEEIIRSLSMMKKNTLIIAIIFYTLAIGAWSIIGRRFFLPLHHLISIAARLTQGNFTLRAPMYSNDELGTLARTFNVMAESIKRSHEELEEKVLARTEQLNKKINEHERTKRAMLNILDDLQQEKANIQADDARDEAILASIGDGMIAVDAKGKIILINPAAEKLLGMSRKKVLGKKFTSILKKTTTSGTPLKPEEYPLSLVLQNRTAITSQEYCYIRSDGTSFPVSTTVTPVILDDQLIGAIDAFRDITHQKEVDRAKTEFVSLASHQLRTPLSAINWYTEMLLAGDAGPINKEQHNYLEEIYHGNQRMVDLVNSLLNVSRIDLGTFAVDPTLTNVVDIMETVLGELKPQIIERKQVIKKLFSEDIPIMKTDPKLMKIIFQNLLSNAVKYTPIEGTISVTMEVTYKKVFNGRGTEKDGLLIKVQDTGYGIPENQKDKIFTKLFRADNVRAKDTEGTGLGLYIVKAIVDQSDGKIWFESKEGQGTTFFVNLPLIGMRKKEGAKGLS